MKNQKFNTLAISLALAVGGAILFLRTYANSFVSLDDPTYIIENPVVREGLTKQGILWAFRAIYAANWHPMTWISHMLDVQLFGLSPGNHHLTSVLFHSLNAVILFLVLMKMTGKLLRSAFVAALFLVHPLHVESVAWIAERKDVLCTLFSFLALWAYVRFTERSDARWYAVALVLFVFALMSKPMAVTMPFVLLLIDWWPLGRLRAGAAGDAPQQTCLAEASLSQLLIEKTPFLILTAGSSVITMIAQDAFVQPIPLQARVTNALSSYVAYLGKAFWPTGLSVYYPHRGYQIPFWEILLVVVLLAFLTILALYFRKSFPYLVFGWFWYLGTLVPVIGFVQVGAQAMADRYTYVPLIGIFVALAWGMSDMVQRWALPKWVLPVSSATVLLILASLTWIQLGYWKNDMALYRHAVDVDEENWIAQNTLGGLLGAEGRYNEAMPHLLQSIRANPAYADPYFNLGVAHYRMGDRQEAVRYYRESLRLEPDNTSRRLVLAGVLEELGRREEAVEEYQEVLRIDPDQREAVDRLRKGAFKGSPGTGSRAPDRERKRDIP